MPKSADIRKYSLTMLDIVEAVCENGQTCDIPYDNEKIAMRERFQFYGLVRAIKICGHSLAEKASGLRFSLVGPEKKVLRIEYTAVAGEGLDSLYARIADEHSRK